MENKSNPNFPENLNILPSQPLSPSTKSSDAHRLSESEALTDIESPSPFDSVSQQSTIASFGIAGRVWEAAYLLTEYFDAAAGSTWEFDPPFLFTGDEEDELGNFLAIELGSGTGYVGMKLVDRLLRSQYVLRTPTIVITDLPEVCPLMQENLARESLKWSKQTCKPGCVWIRPLPWGSEMDALKLADQLESTFLNGEPDKRPLLSGELITYIICSDLVYFPFLFAPLLRTLLHLSSPPFTARSGHASPCILISYKIRSLLKESPFWSAFGLWFSFSPVLCRPRPSAKKDEVAPWRIFGMSTDFEDRSFIFAARRKPESQQWTVPVNDEDLMSGVGSQGTSSPKYDDTFETLLLMTTVAQDECN